MAEVIFPIGEDGTVQGFSSGGSNASRYVVSATEPDTTGWSLGDVWLDTADMDVSTEAVTRVLVGPGTFHPEPAGAPSTGDILFQDDFTGTSGAAWDAAKWGMGRDPSLGTGGGATLLSGEGVLAASNYGNFAGESMISRRMLLVGENDVNIVFSFRFDSTDSYLFCHARHTANILDRNTGYALALSKPAGEWEIVEIAGYSTSLLGTTQDLEYEEGVTYKARFYVVGTAIKAKVWEAGDAEPGSWGVEVTDATYSSGVHGFSVGGGATNPNPRRVFLDDVIVYDS